MEASPMRMPCLKDHSDDLPADFDAQPTAQAGSWREVCAGCAYELGKRHAAVSEEHRRQYLQDLQAIRGDMVAAKSSPDLLSTDPEPRAENFPDGTQSGSSSSLGLPDDLSIKRGVRKLEAHLIRQALDQTKGNRTRAALLLELSYRALLYKIEEYRLDT
jgi:DNA-binding NtrC family response regulator